MFDYLDCPVVEKEITRHMDTDENDQVTHLLAQNDLIPLAETTQVEIREPIVLFQISTASLYDTENGSHSQKGQNVFRFRLN